MTKTYARRKNDALEIFTPQLCKISDTKYKRPTWNKHESVTTYWDLNLYQSALPSIHVWVIKEESVILYTEFKWRIGVNFGQNAAKNNDLLKKCFE